MSKKFNVSKSAVAQVAKVIGTRHYILCAMDPEKVHDGGLEADLLVHGAKASHLYHLGNALIMNSKRLNPDVFEMEMLNDAIGELNQAIKKAAKTAKSKKPSKKK